MKRRNITRVRPVTNAQAGPQQKLKFIVLAIICVATVAAGFFFAARQHFATMEFGLKNSQLRGQVENLEAERRRLILTKEMSLSPTSIKQTASKLGFKEQLAVPPSAAELPIDKVTEPGVPSAELAAFKTRTSATIASAKAVDEKKLVKPTVQQAAIKMQSPNQRPRIATSETVAVSIVKAPKVR